MSEEVAKTQNEGPKPHGYKLALGQFHRYTGPNDRPKQKKRHISLKKKVRDLKRLLEREGLPKEIIEAKKKDLDELKGQFKHRKNALRNAAKYREIRLNEKKKCYRIRKRAEKEIANIKNKMIGQDQTYEEFEAEKESLIKAQQDIIDQCDKDLVYINNFPPSEKYISLYIKTEMPEDVLKKREELRQKAEKQRHSKEVFKRREMKMADKERDDIIQEEPEQKKSHKKKKEEELDNFFVESDAEVERDEYDRIVDKNGKVIKVAQPNRKIQYEGDKKDSYIVDHRKPQLLFQNNSRNQSRGHAKPPKPQQIKIKARSYRAQSTAATNSKKKQHIKF